MARLLIAIVTASALALAVAACGSNTAGTSPAGSSGLTKTVGPVKVDVALTPSPPVSSKETSVQVTLTSDKGQPIADGRVVVTLAATGAAMSPDVVTAQPRGNGLYAATLKPAGMRGTHSLTVDVTWQDKPYQAKFDGISVK